jgi:hypothetical protein
MTVDDGSPKLPSIGQSFSPIQILNAARRAVPAVDYALGAAGIAAAGAIVTAFLGKGKASIIILGGMMIAMVMLFIFSRLVTSKSKSITYAGLFLTWAILLFFTTFLIFTATAVAMGKPLIWAGVLGLARNNVSPIDQLAGQIDYGVVGSNQDAIASLVGMAMVASNKNEKEEIVQKLKRKLTYPETRDFDRTSRQIRKALFEGILKIKNYDVHTEFINGELKGIDLVGVDARNANLQGIKFNNAFIVGTNFSASNLQSADLTSTDLRNVQFQNANLNGTILSMADWFNARGFTPDQMNVVDRTGLQRCPKGSNGSYSERAFIEYADSDYAVPYRDWTEEEQRETARFWHEYLKPGGLCDLVASFP